MNKKRAQYDQFGHAGPNQGFGGGGVAEMDLDLKIFSVRSLVAAAVTST